MNSRPHYFLLLALTLTAGRAPAAEWPQWRGPDGLGLSAATGLPLTWSKTNNIAWKTALPGRAWSSPVIDGRQVWVTTALETAASPQEVQRRLKINTGDQPLTVLEKVEFRALCLDRETGKISQNIPLLTVREPQWVHQLNSYASPSPILETGRLYAHFGALGNACLDTRTGNILWTNTDLVVMHENGPGGSPVLWQNLLIFHLDGSDRQEIAALDKNTGRLAWRTPRSGEMRENPQMKKCYSTPLLLTVNGQTQVISPASDWVYAYDPANGKELWKINYGQLGFSLTPRPVAGNGMIYMSTGFGKKQMLAIQVAGVAEPRIAWRFAKGVPTMPSPLLAGKELYFVDDGGFFTCLDALSGAEIYRERLAGNFSSSPTFADGRLFASNREGATFVIEPGRQFKVLATNELPGQIFASLAAVDKALFLRTDTALYRIEKR